MKPAKALQQKLAAFITDRPDLVEELFRYTEPELRAKVLRSGQLELHDAIRLVDRATYISKSRIVHHNCDAPRCGDKIIYDEAGAHAKSNRIWNTGRGRMRVYQCPRCQGYHLTHTAARGSSQQAA